MITQMITMIAKFHDCQSRWSSALSSWLMFEGGLSVVILNSHDSHHGLRRLTGSMEPSLYGGFLEWGYPWKRMVCRGKSYWNGWVRGTPYVRKRPYIVFEVDVSNVILCATCHFHQGITDAVLSSFFSLEVSLAMCLPAPSHQLSRLNSGTAMVEWDSKRIKIV